MEERISDTAVHVYCSCHGFLIGQSWESIVYSMTVVCSTVFLHIQGRMWCCAECSSFCVRMNIEGKVMMMTVVLVNRLGEVWIHSAFVQLVHLLKEQQYQVFFERFSLWKFNTADTRYRPQTGCCCLPTQAAGWGAVIRLERSGWQWPDERAWVCVFLCWCQNHAHSWCHDWLAEIRHPELCGPYRWWKVCDAINYSCSLPLSFITFCLSCDAYGGIWDIALYLLFSISKQKQIKNT